MAAFDHIKNMSDVALRPRLLRTIIRDYLPEDKHPFGNPSQLSKVVTMIQTHDLLSESFGEQADQKLIEKSKSAVDSWLEHLLQLVSSDMPDKCWAGICLLGVTCQECSSDRFLTSYSAWFLNFLEHIQSSTASQFVKVASCASMSDMLTRLGGFPNLKKDGSAHAGRLVQPVLNLLNDDHSEAIWEGAVHLLCTIISFFPFSIIRHYDSAEAAIATKLFSRNCSVDMLKKLACCLALLPKSKGDEGSWSLMMQKILLWINHHLNDAFQGFEEENKAKEAVKLLVQPGQDPPQLGGLALSGEASQNTRRRRSEQLLTSSVSALMLCCCTMLTSSYPVQVTVPVRSLLALIDRVLTVDGSLPHSLKPFVTAMQQEFISSELPVLHLYSLELLTATIKGVRSQLLPHAAFVMHLISVYFKKCKLPELRAKIYSITKILLISMGVGMAVSLAPEIVDNAFADLGFIGYESGEKSSNVNSMPSSVASPQPNRRKRKHVATRGSLEEGRDGSLELGAPKDNPTALISLRIAALETLEALLTVGGTLKSEGWRSDLDGLLINTARNSLKAGWAREERNFFLPNEPNEIWANLQLAALHALLASFLSSCVRSPYLSQGLELFRRGKQETGTKLAEFCSHALLALEVLIHPRALPLEDFPTSNSQRNPENNYFGNPNYEALFLRGAQGMGCNTDPDYLCESWPGHEKVTEFPESMPRETVTVIRDTNHYVDGFGNEIPEHEREAEAANADTEIRGDGDEVMVDSNQLPDPDSVSTKVASVSTPTGVSTGAEITSERRVKSTSDSGAMKQAGTGSEVASGKDVLMVKSIEFNNIGRETSTTSVPEKSSGFASESDMEPFPDIVDADPDSDYE
ncbi:hypothetical protein UlMin_025174 [Ulmus minor]